MKKLFFLLLSTALPLAALEVIIDHDSPEAVRDFQYHMRRMTGKDAPLTIFQHPYGVRKKTLTREAFRIKAEKKRVYISGESAKAVSHGLYELLNRLGCDWVMPGRIGEIIPVNPAPQIPDCDFEQAPSFDVRSPWYSGGRSAHTAQERADYDLWKRRHKLQLERNAHPLIMQGGHVWDTLCRKYKKEFESDPAMYALVRQLDGSMKRKGPQVETTNQKVLALFERYIREVFAKNKWPKDHAVCIGVGPADGGGYSESAETRLAASGRIDAMTGDPDMTDIQILLCNQLLERLGKEFPNLCLGFYLYNVHADFPIRYPVHPRIVIVIADISYSRLHSTLEPVPTRIYYRHILKQWNKTPNLKFFRGYNWNLAENFLPYSKLKMWADDLPLYHRMNVRGVYNETSKAWATLAPSNYLEAKMLWDIKADPKRILHDFCRAAYGQGAPMLEQYYIMLTQRQSESGQEAGSFHSFHLIYDHAFIARAQSLFDQAERSAVTPEQKERIAIARFPLNQLEGFLTLRHLQTSFRFSEAKTLFDRLQTERRAKIAEGRSLVCEGAVKMLDRFFRQPLEESMKYSSAPYRMVFPLPDKMITIFDPYNSGAKMGFAAPGLNDQDYLRTKTFSTTWAAQGLIGVRSGSVWYRIPLPKLIGQEFGLLIGGADSLVRVYCNGQYVGAGAGFARPIAFDLTGMLSPDTPNLLAIQVERRGSSEVGTGGLIYPSFIFSGPRLKQRAPLFETGERLLPGGAAEKIQN